MPEETFPVLWGLQRSEDQWTALGCPKRIPWDVIAPHEAQAQLKKADV